MPFCGVAEVNFKMNTYWSQYVQYTEELYRSRALRFHDGNKELWLSLIGVQDGMNVLEVGCGSGIFCHRIKTYLPNTTVTGIDLDTGHIEYARKKSADLGIDCNFVNGDATALPFEENTFDLCFSYTVIDFCEPTLFINQQRRVLKPGGTLTILNILGGGINSEMWKPEEADEEKNLFDKLWAQADKNELSHIKKHPISLRDYPANLQKAGLKDIKMDVLAAASYNPDSSNVSDFTALEQINENRFCELCSVQKAKSMAPTALTDTEFETLVSFINRKYDQRIAKYQSGEKLWDFSAGITFAASGKK